MTRHNKVVRIQKSWKHDVTFERQSAHQLGQDPKPVPVFYGLPGSQNFGVSVSRCAAGYGSRGPSTDLNIVRVVCDRPLLGRLARPGQKLTDVS